MLAPQDALDHRPDGIIVIDDENGFSLLGQPNLRAALESKRTASPGLEIAAFTAMNDLSELGPGWRIVDGHHLEKTFEFPDFVTGLGFVNRVGALAEEANHHPDVYLAWGNVRLTIFTHTVNGLTQRDFALAAAIDRLH
jgi:4a-hydroxytetrahydrobiopterin dehydratase